TSGGTSGGTTGSVGGPTILDLSANTSTLQPGQPLVVTAVVTHPDGIAQVVGGKLADPNGGTYGAFQVSTVSGAWSITLTWEALTQVKTVPDRPTRDAGPSTG